MDRRLIPIQTAWEDMRAAFKWRVPEHFNIATETCDYWATKDPDRLAIRHLSTGGATQDWTFGDLRRASDKLAAVFKGRGVQRTDRIAVLMPQHPAVMITHLAAMKLGAISLPIFSAFGVDALAYRLADSGAKVLVTEQAQLKKIHAIKSDLQDLKSIFSIDGGETPFWNAIDAAPDDLCPVKTKADDPAMIIYTSGTTGPPKGVVHAHRFLLGHLPSIETSHEGFPQNGDFGWTPADWAWIGGLMDMAMPCLYYGVSQLCHRMEKFDPSVAFDLIERFGVKNVFFPPTALKLMRKTDQKLSSPLRTISSGGEALGHDLVEWGKDALGAPINEIYGQTECNLITTHTGTTMKRCPGTLGKPVPGFDVAILDDQGAAVTNQLGEIAVRAPNPVMFLKYWNKPDETAQKLRNGWLLTGDLGVADANGYMTYHGRNDDIISSAGYRIGPTEIENCLTAHPNVIMAAAIGRTDPIRGQIIHAFVTLNGSPTEGLEEELIARVRQSISPHVAPKRIHFIDEMPLTTTGKIMRRELRNLDITE